MDSSIFSESVVFIFALTLATWMTKRGFLFFGLRGGFAGVFIVFLGNLFQKDGQDQFNNHEYAHHERFAFAVYFAIGAKRIKISF